MTINWTAWLLALTLLGFGVAYWLRSRAVGDDLGARLDALAVNWVTEAPPADRYARFEHRDYSGDRGSARWDSRDVSWVTEVPPDPPFYAELRARFGDPLR